MSNESRIINSYAKVDATGHGSIGGLCEHSCGGVIMNCNTSGKIKSTDRNSRGLLGYIHFGGVITNCHSSVDIQSTMRRGRLIGTCLNSIV